MQRLLVETEHSINLRDGDANHSNPQGQADQMSPQTLVLNNSVPTILIGHEEARQSKTNLLRIRISDLCKKKLQDEPWYFDAMLLIMAVTIAVATFVLPLSLNYFGATDLPLVLAAAIAVCLVCPLPILLCGILHGINLVPEHRQSQQRCSLSVFVVELAIGRGKAYRIARVIYFVCFPTSIIVFWILGKPFAETFYFISSSRLVCHQFCCVFCCVLHDSVLHLQPSVLETTAVTWGGYGKQKNIIMSLSEVMWHRHLQGEGE